MPTPLNGPGVGLPFPQNLYPTELQNAPQDSSSNRLGLAPGDSFVLPAGDWYVGLGFYLVLQYLDPVTGNWHGAAGSALERGLTFVKSDGFNVRVANLTGCVYSVSVANGGSNYVQATTTVTAIGGFTGAAPTIQPIVGGALAVAGGTLTNNGAGYGIAPIVMIPPPPPAPSNPNGVGGIPATAIAVIANGTVSSISMTNVGAGYPSAPVAAIVPSPFDPNLSTGITQATVAFSLTSAGIIMGAQVTNNGSPLPNGSLGSVTLSIGGAGTGGSLTANVLQTVVSGTLSSIGTGYTGAIGFTTYGGAPAAGALTNNPNANELAWIPRQAQIASSAASLAAPATIYDGGLFQSAPSFSALSSGAGGAPPTSIAGLTGVMGSRYDYLTIQAAP